MLHASERENGMFRKGGDMCTGPWGTLRLLSFPANLLARSCSASLIQLNSLKNKEINKNNSYTTSVTCLPTLSLLTLMSFCNTCCLRHRRLHVFPASHYPSIMGSLLMPYDWLNIRLSHHTSELISKACSHWGYRVIFLCPHLFTQLSANHLLVHLDGNTMHHGPVMESLYAHLHIC